MSSDCTHVQWMIYCEGAICHSLTRSLTHSAVSSIHPNTGKNAYTVTERVSTILNGWTDRGPIDCGETNATKLQKLQNGAARVLTHSSFDADTGPLFEQLKWCPLARRRESHMATVVYKSLNRLVPEYLQHKFVGTVTANIL